MNVRRYRFGDFELEARTGELRRDGDGESLLLPEQSRRALVLLLRRPGRVVSRAELHESLWPNDEFGDLDHRLNNVMLRLRNVLGDDAAAPLIVETVPSKGYRLVCPVETLPESASPTWSPSWSHALRWALPAAVLAALAVVTFLFHAGESEIERGAGLERGPGGELARSELSTARRLLQDRHADALREAWDRVATALSIEPDLPEAWSMLAQVSSLLDEYGFVSRDFACETAETAARRALELSDGAMAVPLAVLARTAAIRGEPDSHVEPLFDQAIASDPRSATVHMFYALWLNQRDRLDEGHRHVRIAVRLEPGNLHYRANEAAFLLKLGRVEEAEALLRDVLALDPENAFAYVVLGRLQQRNQRMTEALSSYETSVELSGGLQRFRDALEEVRRVSEAGRDSEP